MKSKLYAMLLCLSMVCPSVVMAEKNSVNIEYNNETGMMQISGTLPDDAEEEWVTIRVLNEAKDKTVYLTQVLAEDGAFETQMAFDVGIDYDETKPLYNIEVNYLHGDTTHIEEETKYVFDAKTKVWKNIAEAADSDGISAVLNNTDMNELCDELDLSEVSYGNLAELSTKIKLKLEDNPPKTIEDVKQSVREALIFTDIETNGANSITKFVEQDNKKIINLLSIDKYNEAYKIYLLASPKVKSAFEEEICKYYNNGDELKQDFEYLMMISTLKNADIETEVTYILDKCGEAVLGEAYTNSEYSSLSGKKLNDFVRILKKRVASVTNHSDLINQFKLAMSDLKSIQYNDQSINGGGGGSSSSRGSGTSNKMTGITPTVSNEQTTTATITDMFTDIEGVQWAKKSINELAKKRIISGKTEYIFAPNDKITREEYVKLLVLALSIDCAGEKCDFDDVTENHWAYSYIAGAYNYGIVKGISDVFFGIGSNIKREDMAVIAYRALELKEMTIDNEPHIYNDSDNCSSYATEAVSKISAMGIMNGVGDNMFNPKAYATRAEAAKIIYDITMLFEENN